MGIVNLTDDSFYAGSRCADVGSAVCRIRQMLDDGADIIDIGACSSRPGSVPVSESDEWRRLEPLLKALRADVPGVSISVDTFRSSIVRRVFDTFGEFIVNDISAGEDDPQMLKTVGRLGLRYVAMHKRGTSVTMQEMTDYEDVVDSVYEYFLDFARRASDEGVEDWILDPGFGFAKTVSQNYALLSRLDALKTDYRGHHPDILVGVSRKSMIYKPLGIDPESSLAATQAVHMAALIKGADILRVHDVSEARQTVSLYHNMSDCLQ